MSGPQESCEGTKRRHSLLSRAAPKRPRQWSTAFPACDMQPSLPRRGEAESQGRMRLTRNGAIVNVNRDNPRFERQFTAAHHRP